MKKDFYEILEISKVLMQQLRKHRKKALEHHPDKILEQIGRRKVQGSR
jgi:DnaJ-class molecular chaperone